MFNYFISHKNKEISCFPASIIDEINEGIQTNTNTIKMESSSSGSYYCNTYPIASAPGIVSVTDRTPPSSMVVSSGYSKLNWFSENLEIWGENAQNVSSWQPCIASSFHVQHLCTIFSSNKSSKLKIINN